MNYDLTLKELLDSMQNVLEDLKGKNSKKEGGFSKMVDTALLNMPFALSGYYIEVNNCAVEMYCAGLEKNVEFANIIPKYKADKRTYMGYGDYIENVSIKLVKDPPMDWEVLNISQWLDFTVAKENFTRLERQQRELLEEYKENLKAMKKMQDIMKYHSYSKESKKEAEEALDILHSLFSEKFT